MATFSRRVAVLALGSATAILAGIAGPVSIASAADPISGESAPTLTGPANDPTGANLLKNIVLSWDNNAEHATGYQVQMSPNGDWTNNTVTLPNEGKTVNTVYEVPISLPHSFYFWRVRATDANGTTSWSSARTLLHEWQAAFNITQSPTSANPTVSWTPVADASVYRVRFSTERNFSGSDTHTCWTANTSFTPYATNMGGAEGLSLPCFDTGDLNDKTDYYWDVVAFDDTTAEAIAADTTNDPGWDCPTAQPECDTYLPAETLGNNTFEFVAPRADTSLPLNPPTGLTTTWFSNGVGAACDATNDCPSTPTFSWNAVPGANFYQVHVWRDPLESNTYRVYDVQATNLTPRDNFFDAQAGTPYFWSVESGWCRQSPTKPFCAASKAKDPVSPDCPAASTTPVSPPTADTLAVSPAGPRGAQSIAGGDTATVTLTGTNIDPSACVKASDGIIQNISVTAPTSVQFTYIAPSSSDDPVTFEIVNPNGDTSADSPPLDIVGKLETKTVGPLATPVSFGKASDSVPLTSPANGAALNGAQNLTFSWQGYLGTAGQNAYDVRNYHLQVARDANFNQVVWDVDSIDFTRFTNATSRLGDGLWYWHVQGIDESGHPLTWSNTRSFTRDATPPVFKLTDSSPTGVTSPLHVSVNDAALQGFVSQSTLNVVPVVGGGSAVAGSWNQTSATTWTFTPSGVLTPGQTYALSIVGTITDQAGNNAVASSRTVRTSGRVEDNNPAWHYSSGWKKIAASGALGGTFHRGSSGATAVVHLVGRTLSVYACKAPHSGHMTIRVDGTTLASPSLAQSFTKCGVLVYRGAVSSTKAHTLKIVAKNGPVELDRVAIS